MTRIDARTALLLTLPPLLWAGNAVIGRMMVGTVAPLTLNFLRWVLAALILLPLGWRVLRPGSPLWSRWRRFALLGLYGIGCYNSLQYLALQTSTPINVTLIAASMPVWMIAIGVLLYRERPNARQLLGAALSLAGVLFVISHGSWDTLLQVRLVAGDLYMLLAVLLWGLYSWMLARPSDASAQEWHWSEFLLGQLVFGILWSGLATGVESQLRDISFELGWPVVGTLLYVSIAASLVAYRCWGVGVARVGPAVAAFFSNLMPVFAAVLSAALLGEAPAWYHAVAFALIVAGIVVSSRR
ncbi:DMT family transporter [Caldimonas thermodepolymerans]|jgi:drug/metabolite transporter (DMT)-like permease|uniref:Drug/metabolite transporter (DMT)-like permease n=1 Tax=Caldimonas thermodepolymerans TaxID=215580 RepID=A0A2S5T4E6_9BURK|nr:DMT family transporter [Caldimonas thermodepolymerans]PPE69864.1 EamA family transporter [Caldimonas thermodepolymerans]QPC32698.1 DMT family transporter [Caldimonas thermodepolymerans]RDI03458.1 drug/metabolite transporter (DMT)-like permease [Caldimonas thermodepolymerans]TCP06683.1 drug/metabolite transporter (DMT)-like permease [Caldimonas thermodepolymerans]UZG45507.1 DMT family transporter [Caldimonas thermodepolymerans]